ncbi:MAG: hypothetical protein CML13_02240 [Puniceicoccaceae bacterium]|nr:hypothetical protein [Puniceicoccaceae bacterium]|tara:strand:+ start:503 stop:1351 length:849 start_codon:yes stop_codon:yes gene_type:complete
MKIGIIGLDSTHALHFPCLLAQAAQRAGVEISYPLACQAHSPNLAISAQRVERITEQVVADYGCTLCEAPEELAQACDGLLILSFGLQVKQAMVDRVLPFGKALFIDKPLAPDSIAASKLIQQADHFGTPTFSASALPLHPNFIQFAAECQQHQSKKIHLSGPLAKVEGMSARLFYGVHYTEMAAALLEDDCLNLQVNESNSGLHISGECRNGRKLSIEARYDDNGPFRLVDQDNHTAYEIPSGSPGLLYSGLAAAIAAFFIHGKAPIPLKQVQRSLSWLSL